MENAFYGNKQLSMNNSGMKINLGYIFDIFRKLCATIKIVNPVRQCVPKIVC